MAAATTTAALPSHVDAHVDDSNAAALQAQALSVCKQLLPGWAAVEALQVDVISGGITNKLYKLTASNGAGLEPVLLRLYGQGTDFFTDRTHELRVIAQVNAYGFGCKVLGTFAGGRLEQFLQVKALEPHEMLYPAVAAAIATRLAAFHAIGSNGQGQQRDEELFGTIRKWFAKAMALDFSASPERAAAYAALDLPVQLAEFEELAKRCTATQAPVVFGHNDLLSGNVLVPREYDLSAEPSAPLPEVQFIDFEYASATYRGFDIGNHFNECAGFDCVWEQYPSDTQAQHFMTAYLKQQLGRPPTPSELRRSVAEAHLFALASHTYWAVWAVLQAAWSSVEFDYLSYAGRRWERYYATRDAVLAAVAEAFEEQ